MYAYANANAMHKVKTEFSYIGKAVQVFFSFSVFVARGMVQVCDIQNPNYLIDQICAAHCTESLHGLGARW